MCACNLQLEGGGVGKLVPIYTWMYGVSESYVEMYAYADPTDSEYRSFLIFGRPTDRHVDKKKQTSNNDVVFLNQIPVPFISSTF